MIREVNIGRRFRQEEAGAAIVELGLVLPVFLLLFFGLIDFGRLAFHIVTAEKAMYDAARIAAVRAAACPGVATRYVRPILDPSVIPPRFGTSCSSGANVCWDPGDVTCAGDASNATAAEVWDRVALTLPTSATIADIRVTYSSDLNLGFLGGPYIPIVTVELQNIDFEFISPLGGLMALASGSGDSSGWSATIPFPAMSTSIPGEDLAIGTAG